MESHAPSSGPGTPSFHAPRSFGPNDRRRSPVAQTTREPLAVHSRPTGPPPARWRTAACTDKGALNCGTEKPGGSCRPFRAPEGRRVRRSGRPTDRRPDRGASGCGQAAGGLPAPPDAKHTVPTLPRDTDPGSCRPSRAARRRACQILTGASTGVKPAKRRRSSASMATLVIWSELCVSPLAYGRGACCPGSRLLLPSCWRSLQHGGGRGTARPGLVARELPHRQTLAAAAAEAVRTETVREPLPSPCPSASWTGAMCASSSVPSAP